MQGIVHRDLKPENILIHQNCVKLGDFDLATFVPERTGQAAGTPAYTAPEVLTTALTGGRVEDVTEPKNDVFALGLVTLECLTHVHPFVSNQGFSASDIIASSVSHVPVSIPDELHLSQNCVDWLQSALQKDPRLRLTAQQLLQHGWFAPAAPNQLAPARAQNSNVLLHEPPPC